MFLYEIQKLSGVQEIVGLDLLRTQLLSPLSLEDQVRGPHFAVGCCLFRSLLTDLSMAFRWRHFSVCTSALFLMVALGSREIFLSLSLARTVSRSLIGCAVTHSIVFPNIIYVGVKLMV